MPEKTGSQVRYHAYLLRFWQTDDNAPWRASLEDPHNGTTHGFASMKELFAFLDSATSKITETDLDYENN
jgi:hypothetical protein